MQSFASLVVASGDARVVTVSSGAGPHGDATLFLTTKNGMGTSYAVAKAALNALTVKLALEPGDRGVLVNAVDPGFTATFEGAVVMARDRWLTGRQALYERPCWSKEGPTGGFFRDEVPLAW